MLISEEERLQRGVERLKHGYVYTWGGVIRERGLKMFGTGGVSVRIFKIGVRGEV